jgi:hypothetical protein
MVNLHFLGLMEALLECQSTILAKLMPLWCPVLQAYNIAVGYTYMLCVRTLRHSLLKRQSHQIFDA